MFKKVLRIILFSLGGLIGAVVLLILILSVFGKGHFSINLPVEHKAAFALPAGATFPAALHVEGNQLVNAQGEAIRLRGIMIPDPKHLNEENRFKKATLTEIQAAGANVDSCPGPPGILAAR